MKRVLVAAVMLAVILLACWGGLHYTRKSVALLMDSLEEIQQAVQQEGPRAAEGLCREYNNLWHEREPWLGRFIRHQPLDTITGVAAQLESLSRYGDTAHLMAALDQLEVCLSHVLEEEIPSWKALL